MAKAGSPVSIFAFVAMLNILLLNLYGPGLPSFEPYKLKFSVIDTHIFRFTSVFIHNDLETHQLYFPVKRQTLVTMGNLDFCPTKLSENF